MNFVKNVRQGDAEVFLKCLQSFFADNLYELVRDLELHYQNVLFIVFKLLGFYTRAEYYTSSGRIDMVVKNGQAHLCHGIQTGRNRRRGLAANQ